MFCLLFALLLLQPACSSSSSQTPVSGTPAGDLHDYCVSNVGQRYEKHIGRYAGSVVNMRPSRKKKAHG